MNAEFVNPFLQALQNVMSMMAQTELKPGKPQLKKDDVARGDVSGIIGMVGPQIKGSFSISFEENLACEIMNKMLGEMEKIVANNLKLKTEMGVDSSHFWKATGKRFSKINERMIRIANRLKELSQ